MKYYVQERAADGIKLNRDLKLRGDIEVILRDMGYEEIEIQSTQSVTLGAYRDIRDEFEYLQEGDVLIFQFPIMTSKVIMRRLFKSLGRRGVRTYIFIHDLNNILEDNNSVFCKLCDGIIINNEKAAMELIKQKLDIKKIVNIELMDYLIPDSISGSCGVYGLKSPVIIAGKLTREEAGYIYRLPDNYNFNLYGEGFEGNVGDNVKFCGNYRPSEMPFMFEGSFGLVWDGTTPMTCLGLAGQKMKKWNPQQLSLYLAAGLPVIVWSESAIADFVIQKGCGFTVSSLAEIGYRIQAMSEKTYKKMRTGAEDVGIPMRDGCYTRRAVLKVTGELEE